MTLRSDAQAMGIRALRVLAASAALLVLPAGSALADCTSPPSLGAALADAEVVFIGEVEEAAVGSGEVTIHVLWIWKGRDLSEKVVATHSDGTGNETGFSFRVGATYVVVPSNASEPFEVDRCGGTRRYRAGGEVIPPDLQVAVGASAARTPLVDAASSDATRSVPNTAVIMATAALVMGITIGTYRFVSRRGALKGRSESSSRPRSEAAAAVPRKGDRGSRTSRMGGLLSSGGLSGNRRLSQLRRRTNKRQEDGGSRHGR